MPAIHIGDIQIPVQMVQQTTPSLKIMDATGTVYYADAMAGACPDSVKVSDGTNVYSVGTQYLYYESDSVNSCDTISLPPGCYSVQVRGGRGGAGGGNGGAGMDAVTQTYSFTITQQTDAVVFRGGDGNAGAVNTSGNAASGGGGGASGVASMFAINGAVVMSDGGAGGRGAGGIDANGDAHDCGAGGGGNAGDMSNALGGYADSGLGNGFFLCGAGGGGAPSGSGGDGASSGTYRADAGGDGTGTGGGDGGAAHRMLSERSGGDGGATLSFSCGGQMLYSYGGGGGGGVQASSNVPYRDVNGGAGGTGSTEASDTSFVRIYKFGNV